jgi:hypothetical protein
MFHQRSAKKWLLAILLISVVALLGPSAGKPVRAQYLVNYWTPWGNVLPTCVRVETDRPRLRPLGEMRVPVRAIEAQWQEYINGGDWTLSCRAGELPVLLVIYLDLVGQRLGVGEVGGEFPEPLWWFPPGEFPASP